MCSCFSIKHTEGISELKRCLGGRRSSIQLGLQDLPPGLHVQRRHRRADELVG